MQERTRLYNELLVVECHARGIPWLDVHEAFEARRWPYVLAPDRLHEDLPTRERLAELLGELVLAALRPAHTT